MKLEARNFGPVPALFGSARQLLSTNPLLVTIFETQENFLSVHIFIFHFLFSEQFFFRNSCNKKYFISRVQRSLENKKSIVGDKDDETFFIFQSIFFIPGSIFLSPCLLPAAASMGNSFRWKTSRLESNRGWTNDFLGFCHFRFSRRKKRNCQETKCGQKLKKILSKKKLKIK